MADALRHISTRTTAQTVKAKTGQVKNNAGGYVFKLAPKMQLRRFLILGVDGGTYYQNAPELAADNAQVVMNLAATQPKLVLEEIKDVSFNRLAPRAQPMLFALAVVTSPDINGSAKTRSLGLSLLPEVARTSTQLFTFINYAQQFRGWGPALREAVSDWYLQKTLKSATRQVLKYRNREGWTHRDVLRKAHPNGQGDFKQLFDYVCGREVESFPESLRQIEGFEAAKTAAPATLVKLIPEYNLTWEMLPTEALNNADVWRALIDNGLPYTAMMRQLPRLTTLDVLRGDYAKKVVNSLSDGVKVKTANVHPMNILMALTTYASGHGFRGSSSWTPVSKVVDALDAAFYQSFKNVTPSEKRFMLALDVSGSMTQQLFNSNVTAMQGSVAMSMITAAVEPSCETYGFTSGEPMNWRSGSWGRGHFTRLDVSPRRRLDDNVSALSRLMFGRTDCSLPMQYAAKNGLEIDQFVVYTDNETYAGSVHPYQALRHYREKSGIDAKLAVVGMTSTGFSIADPSDPGMLDVVGFDASAPAVLSQFAAGKLQ